MHKKLILIVLIAATVSSFAQNFHNRKLNWNSNPFDIEGNKVYYFKGADFINNMPTYFERFPLNFSQVENVIINNIKYEQSELNSVSDEFIGTEIKFDYKIGMEKKKSYLYLTVYPYIKSNNGILKIVEFSIQIIEKNVQETKSLKSRTYTSSSVLSAGRWIKIKILEDGIYKISYDDLINMGFEIPENIHVYGNGGLMLSEMNNVSRYDDLIDNPIFIDKGTDNIFNTGDYLLFYGKGSVKWIYDYTKQRFIHSLHNFSDVSYYFITSNNIPSNEIESINNNNLTANKIVTSFNDYRFYEKETYNLIKSGSIWFGEHFNNISTSSNFSFNFPNVVTSYQIRLTTYLAARSSSPSSFAVYANGSLVQNISIAETNLSNYTSPHASTQLVTNIFPTTTSAINLSLNFLPPNSSSEGWLNYFELNARRELKMYGSQMHFRDIESIGIGNISEFVIENANSGLKVWDISNYLNPKNLIYNISGSTVKFKNNTDTIKQFIVFNNSNYLIPEIVGEVTNQDLHALPQSDFIIVTHPNFINYANELADIHRNNDNMSVLVVTPEQIYNEFSSGSPDVSAIRDFVKMFYDRGFENQSIPKYLLLFGDGSYDNKTVSSSNSNYILTYQSVNSLKPTETFVSDDFFSLLDDSEGGSTGFEDIGVGRFPVRNSAEASVILNKIKNYINNKTFGDWRNTVCFIGDDEDANTHMTQADGLATRIDTGYPAFNIEKIYLDAFKQISTPAGQRYPDVNKAITDRITKGTLILNYTGHGNELGLAHERIIGLSEINSWDNYNKLFLMLTATCEFSRYDDYNRVSAGEQVLLNSKGGAIALLSTTRLVYSSPNAILNEKFYNSAFTRDENNEHLRLGEIMRLTKVNTGSGQNKRNFTLLGDPALKLAIPENDVKTLTINNISVSQTTDTVKALSKITITGKVIKFDGSDYTNFNGIIYPTVYDKPVSITSLSNDGGTPITFKLQNNILYRGKSSVTNSEFSFTFIAPKDINYSYGNGKISYYYNDNEIDGNGYFKDVVVGGSDTNSVKDLTGPEANLFMNDFTFAFGGITDENPLFLANIVDSNGVNTASGIGHDITVLLDDQTNNIIVLNDYYEAELNSFKGGKVKYKMKNLTEGSHNIKFKVWDVYNNSAEAYLEFIVAKSSELVLDHILNYPNPFTTNTNFYFEHNVPNQNIDVLIQIFSISGKLVKSIETNLNSNGYRSDPIGWDGLDDFGSRIGKGIYIYRIKVKTQNGLSVEKFEKLVILR
ncbi:MAG: hypothetical protein A2046_16090 [Bacteroidetes bacterium GWA2_30_7]|nr:MAG: hypothetical protein A2046_16090 [Bacteroidetes bacterium GWA2_30_7]